MKMSRMLVALSAAALLFGSTAFAKDANKGTLNVNERINVEGKSLDPGTYKVEWNGDGSNVQVTLFRGKDTVATFPAQVTEQSAKNDTDAYASVAQADGSRSLTAIYIGGKHTVLQVAENGAGQQPGTQGSK
jgi:hypothetical protein